MKKASILGRVACNVVAIGGFLGGLWVAGAVGDPDIRPNDKVIAGLVALYLAFSALVMPYLFYEEMMRR